MQRRQFLHNGLLLGATGLLPGLMPLSSVIPAVKPLETIWDAARMRDWDTVIQWLRRDPSLIAVTSYAWYPDDYDEAAYKSTLLHLAATHSDVGVLKYLVSLGADVNAVPNAIGSQPPWHTDSRPPLHFAARYNSVEVLEYLISEGADVHAKCYNGHTPLHCAAFDSRFEIVKCLIAHGADVNAATKYGGTPLHSAAWRGSVEVLQCLVSHGADVNARDNNGKTPLHDAANNSLEVLQYLASRVEDVNAKDDCGMTPLFIAVACNSLDAVKCLVSRGANVGVKNNTDDTLLHNASHIDRLDVLQYLVSLGLNDVNARNASGETPIFNAVTSRYSLDILEYLVSQGADVNVKTDEGFTPLHEAVMSTDVEVVDYLIFHGADVDAKDNEGKTALDRIVEEATECVGEKEAKGSYAEFSTYERIERLHRATGLTHQDTGTHFLTHYLTVNYHVKIDHYEKMRRLADAGDF